MGLAVVLVAVVQGAVAFRGNGGDLGVSRNHGSDEQPTLARQHFSRQLPRHLYWNERLSQKTHHPPIQLEESRFPSWDDSDVAGRGHGRGRGRGRGRGHGWDDQVDRGHPEHIGVGRNGRDSHHPSPSLEEEVLSAYKLSRFTGSPTHRANRPTPNGMHQQDDEQMDRKIARQLSRDRQEHPDYFEYDVRQEPDAFDRDGTGRLVFPGTRDHIQDGYEQADMAARKLSLLRTNPILNFARGAADGVVKTAEGIAQVITSPIETALLVKQAAAHPIQSARAIVRQIKLSTEKEGLSHTLGMVAADVGMAYLPGKIIAGITSGAGAGAGVGVAAAGSVGTAAVTTTAELTDTVTDVGRIAKAVDAMGDLGKSVDIISDVGRAADVAGNAGKAVDLSADISKTADLAGDIGKAADTASDIGKTVKTADQVGDIVKATDQVGDAGIAAGVLSGGGSSTSAEAVTQGARIGDFVGNSVEAVDVATHVSSTTSASGATELMDKAQNLLGGMDMARDSQQWHQTILDKAKTVIGDRFKHWSVEDEWWMAKLREAEKARQTLQAEQRLVQQQLRARTVNSQFAHRYNMRGRRRAIQGVPPSVENHLM